MPPISSIPQKNENFARALQRKMDVERKEGLKRHLRVLGERLGCFATEGERTSLLDRMEEVFVTESDFLQRRRMVLFWSLASGEMRLVEPEDCYQECEFLYYNFIPILREFPVPIPVPKGAELPTWEERERRFYARNAGKKGGGYYWPESLVDRSTHKLTFPLDGGDDILLKMREIKQARVKSYSRACGNITANLLLRNAIIYLKNISESTVVLLGEKQLDLRSGNVMGSGGRLRLELLVPNGSDFQLTLNCEFTLFFNQHDHEGRDGYCGARISGGHLSLDINSSSLEYWVGQHTPFPLAFHLEGIDDLLQFERYIEGKPRVPISPTPLSSSGDIDMNGGGGLREHGEFLDSLQRLRLLRRIRMDYSLTNHQPKFYLDGYSLTYQRMTPGLSLFILFCDGSSLARFRFIHSPLSIIFQLINPEDSSPLWSNPNPTMYSSCNSDSK